MNKSTEAHYRSLAIAEAAKSTSNKRKVGAVVTDLNESYAGHNYVPGGGLCEDSNGETLPAVVHAEVAALRIAISYLRKSDTDWHIFVTHQPCNKCRLAIIEAGIISKNIHIVDDFLKFDKDKLRYDLIPPECTAALAKVLTDGAKKYKPNNWKQGDRDRYYAALMRHLEASRLGEVLDTDSGSQHMAHAMTNAMFILWMDLQEKEE